MHHDGKVWHSEYEVQNIMPILPMRVIPDSTSGNDLRIAHVRLYFSRQHLSRICLGLENLIARLKQHSPWNLQVALRY